MLVNHVSLACTVWLDRPNLAPTALPEKRHREALVLHATPVQPEREVSVVQRRASQRVPQMAPAVLHSKVLTTACVLLAHVASHLTILPTRIAMFASLARRESTDVAHSNVQIVN